ncbi:pescadillo [Dorcoceras hygrometricum]|uniref:Pescadillo n=1 Tax=Dorcoceras hygrometricum TaxID=472368 RepID=A0A2Z7C7Q5_9LAMI|nr:pescadillo [Dorcoceras hygrometricum]
METVLADPVITKSDDILVEVDESPAATTAKDIDLATVTNVGQFSSDEELLSIDDLLKRIPGDMMLPSVLVDEPTGIKFRHGISIPGVADGDLYKASLPKIALTDKGKAPLVEASIIKGHPAREMVELIFGDIEFLIQLREQVIDEVSAFFNYFSLRRLAVLTSLNKDIAAKEENVLTWAETDSVQVALQRKVYILAKYREMFLRNFLESHSANFSSGQACSVMALQIIVLLSDAHRTSVKHLLMQRQEHELQWTRPCCSMLFQDAFDRGFYIPRNQKIFVSTYWLRLLRRIGDIWVVEDGYDRWVHKDENPVSLLMVQLPQQTSLEYLEPICLFSQPVQCLSASTLLPVKTWVWYRVSPPRSRWEVDFEPVAAC